MYYAPNVPEPPHYVPLLIPGLHCEPLERRTVDTAEDDADVLADRDGGRAQIEGVGAIDGRLQSWRYYATAPTSL